MKILIQPFLLAIVSFGMNASATQHVPTSNFPAEIRKTHAAVQARFGKGILSQPFVEYIYYEEAAKKYSQETLEPHKQKIKNTLGEKFNELNKETTRVEHRKYVQHRLALYPELHIRQAMPRVSAEEVMKEGYFANCADFGKTFVKLGLDKGLKKKDFKIVILAEQNSFQKVCRPGQAPTLDPTNLSGIHFSFTYSITYKKNREWFLINPEVKNPEVFNLGRQLPSRGQTFHFPYFSSLGAGNFVVGGVMDIDSFLGGYDISDPINLMISGDIKNRNLCTL